MRVYLAKLPFISIGIQKLFFKSGDFSKHVFARFLSSKSSHFSADKSIVKQGAFIPPNDLELSVYDILSMNIKAITAGPRRVFEKLSKKKALAYAEIQGKAFSENSLEISYNNIPKRHANITGWPDGKDLQKDKALNLATSSNLRRFSD